MVKNMRHNNSVIKTTYHFGEVLLLSLASTVTLCYITRHSDTVSSQ